MAVNGKAKGSSFERKIANALSARFEQRLGIKNGFRRNPDSGSFFGGGNRSRTDTYSLDYAVFGDLICPRNFAYSVECKHYKKPPSIQSWLNHSVTQWDQWLAQAEQDAATSARKLLLVVKYNNVDEMVFLHEPIADKYHNRYKHYYIHRMDQWLAQADEIFFHTSTDLTAPAVSAKAVITGGRADGSQAEEHTKDLQSSQAAD